MPWTFRVKTFSIGTYFETKPIIVVQTRFRRQFQCLLYPDKRRIHMWVKKFMEHGTFLNLNAKGRRDTHSVRPKSARSPVNTKAVRDSVGHNIYMDKLFFLLTLRSNTTNLSEFTGTLYISPLTSPNDFVNGIYGTDSCDAIYR